MTSGVHRPTVSGRLLSDPVGPVTVSTSTTIQTSGSRHTRVNQRTPLLPSDAEVQNVKSSRVYVFGDADVADEDVVEFEMSPLPTKRSGKGKRKRGRKKSTNASGSDTAASQPIIFERVIAEGDTLQNIAVKYGCQIAQLKRINNLMNDQEFFARTTLKVPVLRHSFLTELIEKENQENSTNMHLVVGRTSDDVVVPVTEQYYDDEEDGDEERGLLVRTLSIRDAYSDQSKDAHDWLRKMDSDINKIVSSTNTSKDNLDEVTQSLTSKRIQPLRKNIASSCEIRRSTALAVLIGVVLIPLLLCIWIIYVKHHQN